MFRDFLVLPTKLCLEKISTSVCRPGTSRLASEVKMMGPTIDSSRQGNSLYYDMQ
jgi:hypothetical protein